MKRVSAKQAKRNKKLADMPRPIDGMCAKCHKRPYFPPIQQHHKIRRSDGGKDNKENLEYLCQKCHDKQVGKKSRQPRTAKDIEPILSGFVKTPRPFSKAQQLGRKE